MSGSAFHCDYCADEQADLRQRVDEALVDLRHWCRYNSTDMGELGIYIRLDYVDNGIDVLERRVS